MTEGHHIDINQMREQWGQIEAVGLSEGWEQGEIDEPEIDWPECWVRNQGIWHVVTGRAFPTRYGYQIETPPTPDRTIEELQAEIPGLRMRTVEVVKIPPRPAPNTLGWGDWHEQHELRRSPALHHNGGRIVREKPYTDCNRSNHELCLGSTSWAGWNSNCADYNTTPYEGRRPFWL